MHIKTLLAAASLILTSVTLHATPKVVASIAPLQSLAAMVTTGITQPVLVIPADQSPHDFVLRPSSARAIASADLIIWLGPEGEPNLARALSSKTSRQTLDTSKIDSITRLSSREAGLRSGQHEHYSAFDPHIWLSPNNAIDLILAIRDKLVRMDPDNSMQYRHNTLKARDRIESMHQDIRTQLSTVKNIPFIVTHDSLQYFERIYDLTNLGSIGAHDGYTPGIRRLSQFRNLVKTRAVACALTEAGTTRQILHSIDNDATLRLATIDVLGIGLAPPEEAYFELMTQLAHSIQNCLSSNER